MAISNEVIGNQFRIRKQKELASEKQLASFLEYSLKENTLADYDAKRRLVCESVIGSMDTIRRLRIEQNTSLDLNEMQKLRYKYSAKDAKQLSDALDNATTYQEVCGIAESARARNMHELADAASQKAVLVGEKAHLNSPDYLAAVKAVRRAVEYADSEFYVPELENVMSIDKPKLIPMKDFVMSIIGEGDNHEQIAHTVAESLGKPETAVTPALRQTLNNLDK